MLPLMSSSTDERELAEYNAFRERLYRRRDKDGNEILGLRAGALPKLEVSRLRRCQNCNHWDQGERFSSRVKDHIVARKVEYKALGLPPGDAQQRLLRIINPLSTGYAGLCIASDRRLDVPEPAEFTHYGARCPLWTGSVADDGQADLDAEEVYDRLGMTQDGGFKKE